MSAAWAAARCWACRRGACWVRLWFRPAGLSWCLRVVGAPFMTPAAARRRQDVGRTDSRGCWACRRERVGFACGFALPGDGRHKWRPYVWCGGDGMVGRRWWMLGEPPRACSVGVPVFPAAASVLAAATSVGSGAAAVWTSGLSAEGWTEGYGRGSEVHILLYITGVRGKDMCISAR